MRLAASLWPFGGRQPASSATLRARLHAWWEGYDLTPAHHGGHRRRRHRGDPDDFSGSESADGNGYDSNVSDPQNVWNEARRKLVQILWGEGFIWPGGHNYVHDLIAGFALTPSVSMLEVGAGMSGISRAAVEKFGAYVTALERNADLVEIGKSQNVEAGLDDKIKLEQFDPASLKLKPKYYEAALVRDALLTIENKGDVLKDVIWSLKIEGQLMLTDLFFDEETDDEALEAWISVEPEQVYPWSVKQVKQIFSASNVALRLAEDESDIYRRMTLSAWGDFLHKIKAHEVTPDLMGTLLREAEFWTRRVAALQSGALKYYRILGIKTK